MTTNFDLPALDVAHLTVVAEVKNGTGSAVSGTLQGSIGDASFSQPVTLGRSTTSGIITPVAGRSII